MFFMINIRDVSCKFDSYTYLIDDNYPYTIPYYRSFCGF